MDFRLGHSTPAPALKSSADRAVESINPAKGKRLRAILEQIRSQ
jgi:hypothetical protein